MPPKKKQKSNTPSSPARTTRNRTRSTSVASPAPTSLTRRTQKQKVKSEPRDDDLEDALLASMPAWHGDEKEEEVECWVEIPLLSKEAEEDRLGFVRPRNMELFKAKGKYREYDDSNVWHVEVRPEGAHPFHHGEEDMMDGGEENGHVVAVKPKAKRSSPKVTGGEKGKESGKSRSTSIQPLTAASRSRSTSIQPPASKSRSTSIQPPATASKPLQQRAESEVVPAAEASSSSRAPSVAPAATQQQQILSSQPQDDGLEDIFLGSTRPSPSNDHADMDEDGQDDATPLYFDSHSDEEDRLRNGTPATARPSQQRPRIKKSPSYGDRIAKPSTSTAAQRSRFSTPKPAQPSSSQRPEGSAERIKCKKTLQGKSDSSDDGAEIERKKGKGASEDVQNLRTELNEDAFARSTGVRHKKEYRNKLAKFAEARKKARAERGESVDSSDDEGDAATTAKTKDQKGKGKANGHQAHAVSSGSSSSSSESDDDSSDDDDSSSDSDDSQAFIVGDDEVEYDEGFQPDPSEPTRQSRASPPRASSSSSRPSGSAGRKRYERDLDGRIRLLPIVSSGSSSSSVLAQHGLGGLNARKDLDELCLDWLEWAVVRVLLAWSTLSLDDRQRLERNRAALKSRMRSIEESVGSVAMRRQFKWYLTEYPKINVEALFSDELDKFGSLAKQGCGICHRKSQKPQYTVTVSGLRYNQTTLGPLRRKQRDSRRPKSSDSEYSESSSSESESDSPSSDSDDSGTESDRSNDADNWAEEGVDDRGRRTFTFYAGNHCAQRASVMHKLHHWEWATMQTLAVHDSIRYIRRWLWRKDRMGKGKDGKMGAGAFEVAFCVGEMISASGRCRWKKKGPDAKWQGGTKGGVSELDRLRRRLKSLQEQAIEVNRAR